MPQTNPKKETIEGVIEKSKIYLLWLNHISEEEAVNRFDKDIKELAQAIKKHLLNSLPKERKDHGECCPFHVGTHCGCGFEEYNQYRKEVIDLIGRKL